MMNVNEQPMDQNDDLPNEANDDSGSDVQATPPQSEAALQVQPTMGRSANIGHNSANTTTK
jgi:hypothetical protein